MYNKIEGNLFDYAPSLDLDGIFAPYYSHRSSLCQSYLNRPSVAKNVLLYNYNQDLSLKQCESVYFKMLDTLVSLGAKRIATYPLYVQNEAGDMVGKQKVAYIESILLKWYEKNSTKIESLYYFYFI